MRSRSFVIVAAVLVLTLGLTAGVYAYDSGKKNRIANGITVAGIDVGGLTAAQARSRVETELLPRLESTIVVHHDRKTWKLGPRRAKIRVDVAPVVDEALVRSRKGSIFARVVRGIRGGSIHADLNPEVEYSKDAVVRLLDRVRKAVDRPAKDANLDVLLRWSLRGGRPGGAGRSRQRAAQADPRRDRLADGAERTFVATHRRRCSRR